MFIDPELEPHREESRNLNQLVEAYMAMMPDFGTAEGLAELRSRPSEFQGPPVDQVIERSIPSPAGGVPARVICPASAPIGVHLDLHGGGWCIGSAAGGDFRNQLLANAAGVVVVSIDYRLAPEDPYPAGPDDAAAAARWLLDRAPDEWGVDRVTIGGGSAGAHLAALTALRLRDELDADAFAQVRGLVLDAGAFDLGLTPSARQGHEALVIPRLVIDACVGYFLPSLDPEKRRAPELSPLYAELAGLPPALFVVGTLDPLLDDSLFLYERWRAAGNDAELGVYPDSIHGFTAMPTALGDHARTRMAAFVHERLTGDH